MWLSLLQIELNSDMLKEDPEFATIPSDSPQVTEYAGHEDVSYVVGEPIDPQDKKEYKPPAVDPVEPPEEYEENEPFMEPGFDVAKDTDTSDVVYEDPQSELPDEISR